MFDKLEVIDLCQNKPHHVCLWSWHVCHVRWRTSPCLYLRPEFSLCQDQDAGMAAFYQVVLGLARQWCALHAGESVRQQQSQGWPNYRAWRQQRRRARHGLQAELKDRFSWMSSLLRTWIEKARSPGDRACVRAKIGEAARSGLRGRCVAKGAFKWPCNPCIRCVQSPFSILEAKLQACVHHGVCRHCRQFSVHRLLPSFIVCVCERYPRASFQQQICILSFLWKVSFKKYLLKF